MSFLAAASYTVGTYPVAVAVGDFDPNGAQDLAVINNISNNVSVLLNKGNGTFRAAQNYPVSSNPQSVAVGDFNGDGAPDRDHV